MLCTCSALRPPEPEPPALDLTRARARRLARLARLLGPPRQPPRRTLDPERNVADFQTELLELVARYDKTQHYLNKNLETNLERVFVAVPGDQYPDQDRPCLHVELGNGVSRKNGIRAFSITTGFRS